MLSRDDIKAMFHMYTENKGMNKKKEWKEQLYVLYILGKGYAPNADMSFNLLKSIIILSSYFHNNFYKKDRRR